MVLFFGEAGSSQRYKEMNFKSTLSLPEWLMREGLKAYEYPFGRGFSMSEEYALEFGKAAKEAGVLLSIHGPYFINLASDTDEKQEKTLQYLKTSVQFARLMGADRIVIHPGGAAKGRKEALERAVLLLKRFINWVDQDDPQKSILLGIETHGTRNQLGNLEEIITLCKVDKDRVIPVIDWAHLYAVANGGFDDEKDYLAVLKQIENELGSKSVQDIHMHFSAIEYGPSGEIRHRTFSEPDYGPSRTGFIKALIDSKIGGRIICECAGTQDIDSLYLQEIYETMIE